MGRDRKGGIKEGGYMQKILKKFITCLAAGTFFINSLTFAGVINLASGTRILDILRESRLYYSVIALHSELVSRNIDNLRGMYLEMERIIDGLVKAEKVKRDDINKLKCLVFDSATGDKVYYYFREDGLFFRVARSPDTRDRYSNVLGLGEPVERREIEIMAEDPRRGQGQEYYWEKNYLETYRLDAERMDYVKRCLEILYQEKDYAAGYKRKFLSKLLETYGYSLDQIIGVEAINSRLIKAIEDTLSGHFGISPEWVMPLGSNGRRTYVDIDKMDFDFGAGLQASSHQLKNFENGEPQWDGFLELLEKNLELNGFSLLGCTAKVRRHKHNLFHRNDYWHVEARLRDIRTGREFDSDLINFDLNTHNGVEEKKGVSNKYYIEFGKYLNDEGLLAEIRFARSIFKKAGIERGRGNGGFVGVNTEQLIIQSGGFIEAMKLIYSYRDRRLEESLRREFASAIKPVTPAVDDEIFKYINDETWKKLYEVASIFVEEFLNKGNYDIQAFISSVSALPGINAGSINKKKAVSMPSEKEEVDIESYVRLNFIGSYNRLVFNMLSKERIGREVLELDLPSRYILLKMLVEIYNNSDHPYSFDKKLDFIEELVLLGKKENMNLGDLYDRDWEKIKRILGEHCLSGWFYLKWLKHYKNLKELVDQVINELTSKSPPEWMAQDYRAGYLLMKDAPETGGDSKDGKIKQAKEHLYKATSDPVIRERVEGLLDILINHPEVDGLSLLQYEGIAHRLVKEYSGNPNAYKEYKERLDTSFSEIYDAIRDEIATIPNAKERLRLAMIYSGIGNLIDLSFPDALRRISDDLGIDAKDHLGLVKGVHEKIVSDTLIIEGNDFEEFFNNIKRTPGGLILYFLDNHGEVILDQLVIEELLKSGYRVAVVARGETVRDDVTVDEAGEVLGRNSHLMEYLESGRLSVLTDGSYLLGADLSQSERYPEFLKAWQEASAYIAKGAGNFHTLLGQKLSIPGLHIRMMKGSNMPYERLSQLKGRQISKKSDYDLAFTYQYAPLFDPKKRKPALPTGIGVVAAIKTAVAEAFPDATSVSRKVIAVQGTGGTGASVIKQLLGLGAIVIASDISVDAINALRRELTGEDRDRFYYIVEEKDGNGYTTHVMNPRAVRSFTDTLMHIDAIGEGHVDVFSPCAIGPVLNPETIGELQKAGVKVVCGSCNNVLEDKARDARLLMDAGITFVPDYIANAGGLTGVDGHLGHDISDDGIAERIVSRVRDIIRQSKATGKTTQEIADTESREFFEKLEIAWRISGFDEANEALLKRLEGVYRSEGPDRDDYYVVPIVAEGSRGVIKKGDTLIWINHRGDRSKAALEAFTNPGFNEHGNRFPPEDLGVNLVPFVNYEPETFRERGLTEAFPFKLPEYVTLSQALQGAGVIEGRFAESDKGQHTTYFFDGRRKVGYDKEGIHVEIVPSENVPDRDKKPEMRCREVADAAIRFVEEINGRENKKFLFVNFATDIQGHNLDGDKERARRAVLATDEAVARLREKIRELGGVLIVTADHGNVEEMALLDENGIPLRDEYGVIFSKQHTVQNPVPFIVEGLGDVRLKQSGTLANIAGTVLEILGIRKPEGMVNSLLDGYQYKDIKGPVVVVIRDGWGIARHNNPEADEWNAVKLANPPVDSDLMKTCPWTLLKAHGDAVGLPAYQMGDSDNGHTTIGAGRLVPTLYKDIIEQIEDGRFYTNPVLIETFQRAMRERQDIHIEGLISDGGVHSDYRYVLALLEMAKRLGVDKAGINIYIHAILDGRDVQTRVPTQSGVYYLRKILEKTKELGLNNVALADASGRHFGMDRDAINRDAKGRYEESQPIWQERFRVAYEAWIYGREPEVALQEDPSVYDLREEDIVDKAGIVRAGTDVLNKEGGIKSDKRIKILVPTIDSLFQRGARHLILCAYFGRPTRDDKDKDQRYAGVLYDNLKSGRPIAERLQELTGRKVHFIPAVDPDGRFFEDYIDYLTYADAYIRANVRPGELVFLDNLRFWDEEDKRNAAGFSDFAEKLAGLGSFYVQEGYPQAHRPNSTVVSIVNKFNGKAVFGDSYLAEIRFFNRLRERLNKKERGPINFVLAGVKIETKPGVISKITVTKKLLERFRQGDYITLGGAVAYTFIVAQYMIDNAIEEAGTVTDEMIKGLAGDSLVQRDLIPDALFILRRARGKGVNVLLPVDHRVADKFENNKLPVDANISVVEGNIPIGLTGVDIGPKTEEIYTAAVKKSETILIAGPLGVIEDARTAIGSINLVKAMGEVTKSGAETIAAGGETEALIAKAGVSLSHVSTGGGAALEDIEKDGNLPGTLAVRKNRPKKIGSSQIQGSHIVRRAGDAVEALIYRTGLEVVKDSVSITEPMSRGWYTGLNEYAGSLRAELKKLLATYGPGIFTQVNEIQIVENLGAGDVYPDGRAPLASFKDGVLKIDELVFKYGEHLLFEELEHEFLESIAGLIPGATHALADIVSTFRNVKSFLELGADEKERFLDFLGDEHPIDPDGEYLVLLRRLSEIRDVTEDEIIASVVRYALRTKLYENVRDELGLPEELAGKIRNLNPRLDDALAVFNEIKEAAGLVEKVKESSELAINVVKTFNGIRVQGLDKIDNKLAEVIAVLVKIASKTDEIASRSLAMTEGRYYIVVDRDKVTEEIGEAIRRLEGNGVFKVVYEVPKDYDPKKIIHLVDPGDLREGMQEGILYLPMPYLRSSLYMAANIVSVTGEVGNVDPLVKGLIMDLYKVTDEELRVLFNAPWRLLPKIQGVITELNKLKDAWAEIEKAA